MSDRGMFWVFFDDGTSVKIWCKKDEAQLEALKACAEYNHYYHEQYVVIGIEEETAEIEIE